MNKSIKDLLVVIPLVLVLGSIPLGLYVYKTHDTHRAVVTSVVKHEVHRQIAKVKKVIHKAKVKHTTPTEDIDLTNCSSATKAIKNYGKTKVIQEAKKAGWSDEQLLNQAKKCGVN